MKNTDTSTMRSSQNARQHVPSNIWNMIDKAKGINETADLYARMDANLRKAVFILGNVVVDRGRTDNTQKLQAPDVFTDWQDLPIAKRWTIAYGMAEFKKWAALMPLHPRPADITNAPPDS